MSQTYKAATPATDGQVVVSYDTPVVRTGWTGWVVFAGVMMVMLGLFQVIQGFTALFRDTYFVVASNGLLVSVDYTAWGWTHLFIGMVAFLAGYALIGGHMWGRVLGVILALVSATVQLAFVAAAPVWAVTIIVIDILVIYAICVHGGELKKR